jgi:hypothetical protein
MTISERNIRYQIDSNGKQTAVVIEMKLWKKILAALDDEADAKAFDDAVANDDGTRFSWESVKAERKRTKR